MQIQAHCVESTRRIGPVGWSDYAFLAESKDLPAGTEVCPALRGATDLHIRLANIPGVLERRLYGNRGIEQDMGVLSLAEKLKPPRWLNSDTKPETAQ